MSEPLRPKRGGKHKSALKPTRREFVIAAGGVLVSFPFLCPAKRAGAAESETQPILDALAPREILLEGRPEPERFMPIIAETPWAKLKYIRFRYHASHKDVSLLQVFVRLSWKTGKIGGVKGELTLRTPEGNVLVSKTRKLARAVSKPRMIMGGRKEQVVPQLCFEVPGAHHAEIDHFELRLVAVEAKEEA